MRILVISAVAFLALVGVSQSSFGECLHSAGQVKILHPGSWPSWSWRVTGHRGKQCWYAAESRHRRRARVVRAIWREEVRAEAQPVTLRLAGPQTTAVAPPAPPPRLSDREFFGVDFPSDQALTEALMLDAAKRRLAEMMR